MYSTAQSFGCNTLSDDLWDGLFEHTLISIIIPGWCCSTRSDLWCISVLSPLWAVWTVKHARGNLFSPCHWWTICRQPAPAISQVVLLLLSVSSTHLFPLLGPTCCLLWLSYLLALLSPFLSVQGCQWCLICRTLRLSSTLLHTAFWDRYNHIQEHMDEHAHIHLHTLSDDVSFTLILPLFPAEWKTGLLPVKQPTKWQNHPHPETMFYLIVSIWLLMHIIQYMQHMEQDGWSDYKRIHGLTSISCFRLVQIFSHFLSTLDKDYYYYFF